MKGLRGRGARMAEGYSQTSGSEETRDGSGFD